MVKELYYSTTEKELKAIPIDGILVDDWNTVIELCKEKIRSGKSDTAYIYSILVTLYHETGKRKLSDKYNCFYWKTIQELTPDEKHELVDLESDPKRIDL